MAITSHATPAVLALLLGSGVMACSNRGNEEAGPAPIDTAVTIDEDTTVAPGPDTSMATPPITPPSEAEPDSPPAGAAQAPQPDNQAAGKAAAFSQLEYEGWRQYSVNCARCHGQDVLPNPVAANLLISVRPGGPMHSPESFTQVVVEGRPEGGMPAFEGVLTTDQTQAVYAYVKGRAEGRLPPGRPERPGA